MSARALLLTPIAALFAFATMSVSAAPASAAPPTPRTFTLNELMARNDSFGGPAFLDENVSKQGFVEIVNVGEAAASLLDWTLETTIGTPQVWSFPDRTLAAGQYLVVWLSGKNRASATGPLHTSFTVLAGSALLLRDPAGALVDSLADLQVPPDVSYGRCSTDGADAYYFATPTPGAPNDTDHQLTFVIDQAQLSLTAGATHQLTVLPAESVSWESDNPLVSVDSGGAIAASQDALAPGGQATIRARLDGSEFSYATEVTIVSWKANVSRLEVHAIPSFSQVLASDEEGVYFNSGSNIFKSSDGLRTTQIVGVRPVPLDSTAQLKPTPFGYLLRNNTRVYYSSDLASWSLSLETQESGLRHMFDHYFDEASQTSFVYLGEYSSDDPGNRHKVYRGTLTSGGGVSWTTLLDFPSLADWNADPSVMEAVRHVHVVRVDPYTGHLYVGTGDRSEHARIYFSDDSGDSFQLLGMGSQGWRTLAIWFTPGFVYWSMDSTGKQSVWRIPRSAYDAGGFWPSPTPELDTGATFPGQSYYVTANASPGRFPVGPGRIFTAISQIPLDAGNRVRALDDPAFDYREHVAELANGSHWYQTWAKNEQGQDVSLLGASAEGGWRDAQGRVFGIREDENGDPIVQELQLVRPAADSSLAIYVQLEPIAQDPAGFIYLRGRETHHSFYQARLVWADDTAGPTGGITAPAPPAEICVPLPEPGELQLWSAGLALLAALARHSRAQGRLHRAA